MNILNRPEALGFDAVALAGVAERSRGSLIRSAYRITRNADDAEDVFQEAVLKALTNLHRFRGDSRPETWLHAIVLNTAYNWVRGRGGRRFLQNQLPDAEPFLEHIPDPGRNPEQCCESRELEDLLFTGIQNLHPQQKTVIQMCVLGEVTYKEAASVLSINMATLKARIFHGRVTLARGIHKVIEDRSDRRAAARDNSTDQMQGWRHKMKPSVRRMSERCGPN